MIRERTDGPVKWVVLDRPERLNAFTVAGYRDVRMAVERAAADEATHVVVLTGNGRAFSAGADRSLLDRTAAAEDRERAGEEFRSFLGALRECEKPLIAAVNGLAVGIGCTLLLYFDLVLSAESARFRMPFTALGLVPEAGSSVLLPARARWDETMWALLSSEWIDADTAHRMGLAWRVVPDSSLLEEASNVAATIAALDPASVMATKRLLKAGRDDASALAVERELEQMRQLAARRRRAQT